MDKQISFSSSSLTPLQKGRACVNCRRRKIKCDGGKPICGQCSRFSSVFGDCEYTEHGGASHGQMLEEQISILQARIEELEKPNQAGPSSTGTGSHRSASTSPITPSNAMALGPLLSSFYLQQTSGGSLSEATVHSMPTELPFIVLQALVHNFLHNAGSFGFFLDTQAFHDAVTQPDSAHRLPPVLLNVMYLWGVHLARDPRITAYEPAFLAHALRSTASSLSGTHPRTILHSLQASVLLAYYFLRNARFLEGRYHTSAAVSIALSAGLHRKRGPQDGGRPLGDALPQPRDAVEEGERIGAFWSVLNLNNCWAGMDGAPSNVVYGDSGPEIHTPWPLDAAAYVENPHLLPTQSSDTVTKFLADVPDDATSTAALHAKAGILYSEATRIGARYRASSGLPVTSDTDTEFHALDGKIDAFIPTLPSVLHSKAMLVVHTLAHGATIQLHRDLDARGNLKVRGAAGAIVDLLATTDIPNIGIIDPVLAPLWTSACLVFIAEIKHAREDGENSAESESLRDSLKSVIAAMEVFAPHCRLMEVQLEAVRSAYAAAVENE
ncbi:hypothetical protein C8R46DRAFT_1273187 [Mycena filopes]|nr:hypothetical protein C8R46DRAFT_1273187 [Mycena filopes]